LGLDCRSRPQRASKPQQFAAAGTRVNPELEKIPGEERAKHPDIRIANSNWGSFLDEVITNPAKYYFSFAI